jgi:hypothetical protein
MNNSQDNQKSDATPMGYDTLLAAGSVTKTGFKLIKKVETLDEFWNIINEDKSIFARHRMYPTAFFMSWNIRLIKRWLDAGWFFRACS